LSRCLRRRHGRQIRTFAQSNDPSNAFVLLLSEIGIVGLLGSRRLRLAGLAQILLLLAGKSCGLAH
jgi:hypothetical protein